MLTKGLQAIDMPFSHNESALADIIWQYVLALQISTYCLLSFVHKIVDYSVFLMLLILFHFIETRSTIYRVGLIIWNRNCEDIVL